MPSCRALCVLHDDRDGLTRWERQDIRERYQRIQANLDRYNRRIGGRRW